MTDTATYTPEELAELEELADQEDFEATQEALRLIDRRNTAFHEAGHCLGYWKSQTPIRKVTIIATETTRGMTHTKSTPMAPWELSMAALAGPVAQGQLAYRDDPQLAFEEGFGWRDFVDGAFLTGGDGDFALDCRAMKWAEDEKMLKAVWQMVERYWLGIEAVAEALMEYGTLDGEVVYQILDAHNPYKN